MKRADVVKHIAINSCEVSNMKQMNHLRFMVNVYLLVIGEFQYQEQRAAFH